MRVMRKKGEENTEFIRELNANDVNLARTVQKERMESDT
jgi:hypothetical protein